MPRGYNEYEEALAQNALWAPPLFGAGIAMWFDPYDDRTVQLTGGAVSQISNKGGLGLGNATQATSGNRPTYSRSGFEPGRPGIVNVAASVQYLSLPDLSGMSWTAAEVFYVARRNNDPPAAELTTGPVFVSGTNPGSGGEHEPYTDGNVYLAFFSTARKATGNPTASLAATRIVNVRSAAGAWSYWVDGIQHYSTASNTFALPGMPTIGWSNAFGNNYGFDGVWGELLVFPAILSSVDRDRYLGYLAWKHGLVQNLPVGGSFKNRPPLIGD
jgi:hypothetical protein